MSEDNQGFLGGRDAGKPNELGTSVEPARVAEWTKKRGCPTGAVLVCHHLPVTCGSILGRPAALFWSCVLAS